MQLKQLTLTQFLVFEQAEFEFQPGNTLTAAQITAQLSALEVNFLQTENSDCGPAKVTQAELIAALATGDEARLRLALIPLLLRHPEFAATVRQVVSQLPAPSQLVLKCYYTAAQFLQQKYHTRLQALFGPLPMLPALFLADLGLSTVVDPAQGLQLLAERHRQLSGRAINWLGTYEHGAERLLLHCERLLKQCIRSNEISYSKLIMP